jgi:methylthioribose-1-phosphate isomerase
MQGSKLTVWELTQVKALVTLVPDNAVGILLSEGRVNKVIIGSDRSAANGDIANKVGSYQISVLAKEFGVPVIVLTQPSKGVKTGRDMPIELRDESEIVEFQGKHLYGKNVRGFYPGFDVVPHQFITKAIPIHAGL